MLERRTIARVCYTFGGQTQIYSPSPEMFHQMRNYNDTNAHQAFMSAAS